MSQPKIDNEVINHLLFHKALIDEERDVSRINQYLKMIQTSDNKENLSIDDNPFDRSIAITFDLVLKQELNPWNIDLVNFSTMYLERARKEKIDLMTAGRIIYMAWKVLRLQSDDLVINMESQQKGEDESISIDLGWENLATESWFESDDGYSYTNLVMKLPHPPIEEPIRRTANRKVTLMELLDAFDQARKESEEYQILNQIRERERKRLSEKARKYMKGTAHEDHLEEDVMATWEKISKYPKKSMALNELCESEDPEEKIRILLSVLFLAYDNKIKVYQRRFPYGKIYIKNLGYT